MSGSGKLKLQGEKVTQEVFDRLPALLTSFQVRLVTGWDKRDIAAERKAGRLEVYQKRDGAGKAQGYRKYLKVSVAKLIGMKC